MRTLFALFLAPIWLLFWLTGNLGLTVYRGIVLALFPASFANTIIEMHEYQPLNAFSLAIPLWDLLVKCFKSLIDGVRYKAFYICWRSPWY